MKSESLELKGKGGDGTTVPGPVHSFGGLASCISAYISGALRMLLVGYFGFPTSGKMILSRSACFMNFVRPF